VALQVQGVAAGTEGTVTVSAPDSGEKIADSMVAVCGG